MDLAVACYGVARKLPSSERHGLADQLRRSAASIPANIAEGYGRVHRGDYLRHLSIAQGSLKEAETHLLLAHRLSYIDDAELTITRSLCGEVGRLLTSLLRSLQQ